EQNDSPKVTALRTVLKPDPGPPPPLTPPAARLVRALQAGTDPVHAVFEVNPTWEDFRLAHAFYRWGVASLDRSIAASNQLSHAWDAVDPAHELTLGDVEPLVLERGLISQDELAAALGGDPFDVLYDYAGVA